MVMLEPRIRKSDPICQGAFVTDDFTAKADSSNDQSIMPECILPGIFSVPIK
jgi:hypothetical protein